MISFAIDLSISNNSKELNIIETMSRATKWINYGKFLNNSATLAFGMYDVIKAIKIDGGKFGQNASKALVKTYCSWEGGVIGAKAGAYVGGVIGSYFYGAGALPGAIIGGIVGGIAGSIGGAKSTDYVFEEMLH